MVYKFYDKKLRLGASVNENQAEEWHKPVVKKDKWQNVHERFKGNI